MKNTLWLSEDVVVLSKHRDKPLQHALLLAGLACLSVQEQSQASQLPLFSPVKDLTKRDLAILAKLNHMNLQASDLSLAYQEFLAQNKGQQAEQGSYYTPNVMAANLTQETLSPLIDKAFNSNQPKDALLALRIVIRHAKRSLFVVLTLMTLKAKQKGSPSHQMR